jgi:hypothetical protein
MHQSLGPVMDRLCAKLLASATTDLGTALANMMCAEPDHAFIRAVVKQARESLVEFEEQYASEQASDRG